MVNLMNENISLKRNFNTKYKSFKSDLTSTIFSFIILLLSNCKGKIIFERLEDKIKVNIIFF